MKDNLVFVNPHRLKVPKKKLQKFFLQLRKKRKKFRLKNSQLLDLNLTLVFLTSAEIKKINYRYRKKRKPTDVLSFSGMDEDLGELLLCPEVIRKQAPLFKHTYEEELLYMVLHGILHLLGYDHETNEKDEKKMFGLQNRIFKSI